MPARRQLVTAILLTSHVATASPRKPPPDADVPPRLLELRSEAGGKTLEAVVANLPRYRALCDADGYPLVGNVATKGRVTQPSAICEAVRKAASA